MWGLDHKEGWVLKNWWFRIVVLEKSEFLALQRSNQSILKEINPEDSLEGLMLKLNLQHFGHLMCRAYSPEKILMLGKTEGKRREQQRMSWLDSITDSMDMHLSKHQETVKDGGAWCAVVNRVTKSQTHVSDWTTTNNITYMMEYYLVIKKKYICNLAVCDNMDWPRGHKPK